MMAAHPGRDDIRSRDQGSVSQEEFEQVKRRVVV
jgi:hypothetical protein